MPSSLSKLYDWSLVVDEQELRRLVHEMAGALPQGSAFFGFTVTLSDGSSHTTRNIEDVLKEENRHGRTISTLLLKVNDDRKAMTLSIGTEPGASEKKTIRIPPDSDAPSRVLRKRSRLTVEGDDRDWVYVVYSKLEDRLRAMKATNSATVFFPAFAAYIAIAYLVHARLVTKYPGELWVPNTVGGQSLTTLGGGLAVAAFAGLAGMLVLLAVLYPHLTFKIGDGTRRHDLLVDIRSKLAWVLIGTVTIGTIARLIVGLWA